MRAIVHDCAWRVAFARTFVRPHVVTVTVVVVVLGDTSHVAQSPLFSPCSVPLLSSPQNQRSGKETWYEGQDCGRRNEACELRVRVDRVGLRAGHKTSAVHQAGWRSPEVLVRIARTGTRASMRSGSNALTADGW
jgi:hypothetical protein